MATKDTCSWDPRKWYPKVYWPARLTSSHSVCVSSACRRCLWLAQTRDWSCQSCTRPQQGATSTSCCGWSTHCSSLRRSAWRHQWTGRWPLPPPGRPCSLAHNLETLRLKPHPLLHSNGGNVELKNRPDVCSNPVSLSFSARGQRHGCPKPFRRWSCIPLPFRRHHQRPAVWQEISALHSAAMRGLQRAGLTAPDHHFETTQST